MRFSIITIFPKIVEAYFSEGLIARAKAKGVLSLTIHDLRQWANDRHRTVDRRPFGGGPGMVMSVEPIFKAVAELKTREGKKKLKVVLTSPRGKKFSQKKAEKYSKLDGLIIICGRYEGVDERVAEHIADESISIGDYVLSGGELAAMVIVEATARLVPGVLGNAQSSRWLLTPCYTRPEIFLDEKGNEWRVPSLLLTGKHKAIEEWRRKNKK